MKIFKNAMEKLPKESSATNRKPKGKKRAKWIVLVIVVLILAVSIISFMFKRNIQSVDTKAETVKVERRDIQKVLSSSGTIQPLNTYEVKTLVEGEILAANFEEGDQVTEGDILYQVTSDNLDNKIDTAETKVERAKDDHNKAIENYNKAVEDYEEALADYEEAALEYGDATVKAEVTGTVTTVHVEEGDKVQEGAQIANVYDNSAMFLEVPFLTSTVNKDLIGKKAVVEITDSFELLEGTVTKVSSIEQVLSGNRIVKTVTIQVTNPGGLTTNNTATATIGNLSSTSEGTLKPVEDTVITSDKSGEIVSLNIEEGSKIKTGDTILVLSEDTVENQMDNYEKALDSAESAMDNAEDLVENSNEAIEDAEDALELEIDSKTDYSITAPISGQVIRKDILVGDTITSNTVLCVIYDLSAVTFDMYIDELDVLSVKEGQEVSITADALEGVEIKGTVTNLSLESSSNNGVAQYPVTVQIDEAGDLLPGMNVTGEIIIEKVEQVLAVPSDALMRGDLVYVADETVKEAVGDVPAGFKSVKVETGLSDGDYIEVISGLSGEEEVYVKRTSNATTWPYNTNMNMPENGMGGPNQGMYGGNYGNNGSNTGYGSDRRMP